MSYKFPTMEVETGNLFTELGAVTCQQSVIHKILFKMREEPKMFLYVANFRIVKTLVVPYIIIGLVLSIIRKF